MSGRGTVGWSVGLQRERAEWYMAVLDGYGAIVVDGLGTKKEEEEDGKMGEREFGSVGRFGRGRGGGGPGTVTQFNPRLLAMKPDEMRNRGKMNEQNDREKR